MTQSAPLQSRFVCMPYTKPLHVVLDYGYKSVILSNNYIFGAKNVNEMEKLVLYLYSQCYIHTYYYWIPFCKNAIHLSGYVVLYYIKHNFLKMLQYHESFFIILPCITFKCFSPLNNRIMRFNQVHVRVMCFDAICFTFYFQEILKYISERVY